MCLALQAVTPSKVGPTWARHLNKCFLGRAGGEAEAQPRHDQAFASRIVTSASGCNLPALGDLPQLSCEEVSGDLDTEPQADHLDPGLVCLREDRGRGAGLASGEEVSCGAEPMEARERPEPGSSGPRPGLRLLPIRGLPLPPTLLHLCTLRQGRVGNQTTAWNF